MELPKYEFFKNTTIITHGCSAGPQYLFYLNEEFINYYR